MFSKNKTVSLAVFCLVTLISLPAVSLFLQRRSDYTLNYASHSVPTGTYCSGSPDWPMADTVYLVLGKDNTYMVYRQFEVISRGTYEDDTVSQTVRLDGGGFTASYGEDYSEINLLSREGSYSMKKYSDTCLYINVTDSQ